MVYATARSEGGRQRPVVKSLRLDLTEGALLEAFASAQGVSVSDALRQIVVPEVRRRVSAIANGIAPNGAR